MSYRPINWRSVAPNGASGVIFGAISEVASMAKTGAKTQLESRSVQVEAEIKVEPADSLRDSAEAANDSEIDAGTTADTVSSTNVASSPALLPLDEPLKIPAIPAIHETWQTWEPHLEALRDRDWTWLKVSLFLLAIPAGAGAFAYNWLTAVPESPNCQAPNWSQADFERLQCIHQAMQSGETREVLAGIRQLKQWPEDSAVYHVSQRLLEDWSVVIWSQAQAEYEAGEWDASAKLVAEIPEQFALWNKAQSRSSLWQEVREQGESLYKRAEAAIQEQNWQQAMEHAKSLASLDNDYWRRKGLSELPSLIEAQQASAQPSDAKGPVASASTPVEPLPSHPVRHLPAPPLPAPSPAPSRRRVAMAPVMVSLSRPTLAEPDRIRPEFS